MKIINVDCIIIGGGVSGLSIGSKIAPRFNNIFIIERNKRVGEEISSRNSEVIHSGIYYQKNSLKSDLCIEGKNLLYQYLKKNNIPFSNCGKFIVSTKKEESVKLENIMNNALNCGVEDLVFKSKYLKAKYPFLKFDRALFSPSSGIFDSHSFLQSLRADFEQKGGHIVLNNECKKLYLASKHIEILINDKNSNEEYLIKSKVLINAAGLKSVDIHNSFIEDKSQQITPIFIKGDYFSYFGQEKINHLIYPLPERNGLGVHATIDMQKNIRFGPNAYEIKSIDYDVALRNKKLFAASIKKYWPDIDVNLLNPSYSGIRPKLKDSEDFKIIINELSETIFVSILGYESPGLTSSLSLANHVDNSIVGYSS